MTRAARTLTAALAVLAAAVACAEPPPIEDARGITVSCWGWGWEWSKPEMRELMTTLPEVGANWLAIHPYAHVERETGRLRWGTRKQGRTDHISRPIRWARELGLKIMVKPHISYWGEFEWRGTVGWDGDDPRWQRFRSHYRRWILEVARLAASEGADAFVIGTELRRTEVMVDFWRGLIDEVREIYPGPITYAANWDDFERVPFWDALDYVGVQAYFPLTDVSDPDEAALRAGWHEPLRRMRAVSKRAKRPVLLTEIGYTNAPWAAAEPWRTSRGGGRSPLQERCLRTALEVVAEAEFIVGSFLWKWFPTTESIGPGDFTVQTDVFKQLLRDTWSRGLPVMREQVVDPPVPPGP